MYLSGVVCLTMGPTPARFDVSRVLRIGLSTSLAENLRTVYHLVSVSGIFST
jgi:hypothetical protein